jgi:hypothetical protein
MKTPRKKAAEKQLSPARQLENLRRKIALLKRYLAGESAGLLFDSACGVIGHKTEEHRDIEAAALRRCDYLLGYVLQGEIPGKEA